MMLSPYQRTRTSDLIGRAFARVKPASYEIRWSLSARRAGMRHSARPSIRAASISERGTATAGDRKAGMIVAWNGTIIQERNNTSS